MALQYLGPGRRPNRVRVLHDRVLVSWSVERRRRVSWRGRPSSSVFKLSTTSQLTVCSGDADADAERAHCYSISFNDLDLVLAGICCTRWVRVPFPMHAHTKRSPTTQCPHTGQPDRRIVGASGAAGENIRSRS
jgi:hypothetical protein